LRLQDIKVQLEAEQVAGSLCPELEIKEACAADLMSDVLASARPGYLLLTGLTHPQAVRVAALGSLAAVVFVQGKEPLRDTLVAAEESGLPLFVTPLSLFESCGRLYQAGLRG
jgi:hypothetical protein